MTTAPIYVETRIDRPVDEIWARTQVPELHQRWDVRFSDIIYLEAEPGEPQRFIYSTTVAPRLAVDGRGETLGDRHRPDGTAYSGLKFWSDHPVSLIEEGAGFWRYVPTPTGVRFLTRYDYRVRWGRFGRVVDRFVFRPVFGWATAWSFDRLRLWLEQGITPERARNQTLAHLLSVTGLALLWLQQGGSDAFGVGLAPGAVGPTRPTGWAGAGADLAVAALGIVQLLLGSAVLGWWRHRWPFLATMVAAATLGLAALVGDGEAVAGPSAPVVLALVALAGIALATGDDLPSGKRPLRAPPRSRHPAPSRANSTGEDPS